MEKRSSSWSLSRAERWLLFPEKAGRLLEKLSPDASQASYAIRFAESLPEVEIVLSGMNTMEQLLDNLACRQPADRIRTERSF